MSMWRWIAAGVAVGAATLIYGAVVEANRLVVERRRLRVPRWPRSKDGYRLAVLGDFHLRDQGALDLTRRALKAAVEEEPDAICLVGDYIEDWRPGIEAMLCEALEPLGSFGGPKIAVPGNHDHRHGDVEGLRPNFDRFGITMLRNEYVIEDGIAWVGIDSANEMACDPFLPMMALAELEANDVGVAPRSTLHTPNSQHPTPNTQHALPIIALWHEPDFVDFLPDGAALMLAGHSHGGQFTFPWGWTPMYTVNGKRYPRGFYPAAPTPLFVTRGIGVTGPPSRLCCPPEVAILELFST